MALATTSAVELQPTRESAAASVSASQAQRVDGRATEETAAGEGADEVLLASLAADSGVPEGGYGWVVVCGCAVIAFWFVGTPYSWGVLQAALVRENSFPTSTISFVGSLTTCLIATLAVVNARLIQTLGVRLTGMLGVLLIGGGEILSGFVTHNVGGLFVTTGVVTGVGTSLCFMVVSVVPAQYFSRKRGLANGVVYAGGGLGGTIISFVMNALIQKLGPAWTFRIIGAMTLATALPAAWFVKERVPIRRATFIEWRLLRDFRFVVLFIVGAIATFPLLVPVFFLPLYSNSLGLSAGTGAGLVATFNFSSAIGRLICGFLGDVMGPVNTLFASLMLNALSTLVLWPVSTSLAPLILFVIICGAANGGFFAIMPTVVGNVFGSARVSVAMGMIVTGWMGGYLMGAPIAGFLLDKYGGAHASIEAYHPAVFYAGSMALGAAGFTLMVRLNASRRLFARI